MWWSNCTPEEYSAWRKEQVEEAAELGRYLSYPDLAGWGKQEELQKTADAARQHADQTVSGVTQALKQMLARLRPRPS